MLNNSSDIEFLGFIIKKKNNSFVVTKNDKEYYQCSSEKAARTWTVRFRKMLGRSAALKQISSDDITLEPVVENTENKSNIIAIIGDGVVTEEKYIKITSKKNAAPVLDIKNLDSNEVLGLMRRAEYMITNFVLRNGSI